MAERLNDYRISFNEIDKMAKDIQSECEDFVVSNMAANLRMSDTGNLQFMSEDRPLSDWALGQVGIKLGIPASYLRKCFVNGFAALGAQNVNAWLKTKEKGTVFIRGHKNGIRGFLSGRYTACDAPDILEMTYNTIPYIDREWDIVSHFMTEERMHVRLVNENKMNINSEELFPAIFIDSSDVGRCALHVHFGIYKKACRNGLVIPKIGLFYHQRHIGIDRTDLYLQYSASIASLPDVVENAEDIIGMAIDKKIVYTQEEITNLLHEIRVKAKITEDEAEKVINTAIETYDHNRWGLANALSEYAQEKDLERRLEIEKAAGMLLV